MPQVRSAPDLTAVSHDTTNYASLFEPLKGPSRPLSPNSRSPLREEIYHEEHSRSQNRKKLSQMVTMFCQTDIEDKVTICRREHLEKTRSYNLLH